MRSAGTAQRELSATLNGGLLMPREPQDPKAAEFKAWLKEVDKLCKEKFTLGLSDLPDMLTRDAFDGGATPQEFFDDDVMRTMREDFGDTVDEL